MVRSRNNPWLHRFAIFTALATVCLIAIGGLVTSHGAGLAVPDWPTSYGYNMFLFPISQWVGGIFYEHTHRLVASGVGFLTTILMVWLLVKEERPWLRWLGAAAFFGVVAQGVLGGLRVNLLKNEIGIFHATLAQLFLSFLCLIALMTSRWWVKVESDAPTRISSERIRLAGLASAVVLVQLILGASMRHQHAGLAVPDFPLAYGKVWPATDAASLAAINQKRVDTRDFGAVTATQIRLHMAHRIGAVVVLIIVLLASFKVKAVNGLPELPLQLANVWIGLVLAQAALGAVTVWSNKAADIATAHVVVGAATLATGVLLTGALARSGYAARFNDLKISTASPLQKAIVAD